MYVYLSFLCVCLLTLQGHGKGKRSNAQQHEKSAEERITGNPDPNHFLHPHLKRNSKFLPILQARQKLKEHDVMAHKKYGIALDRMAQKHKREVQIALDKDRIEKEGEIRQHTRIARQATAELVKGQAEQTILQQDVELMEKEHTVMVKAIGRERRQNDVERQTL